MAPDYGLVLHLLYVTRAHLSTNAFHIVFDLHRACVLGQSR